VSEVGQDKGISDFGCWDHRARLSRPPLGA
jgi:hypothetical protein